MGRMQDKVVLITAAADGIGLAAAHRLASEGARIVVSDINADGVSALAKQEGWLGLHHDAGSENNWRKVMQQVKDHHGRLDVLVNNAGGGFWAPFDQVSEKGESVLIRENFGSVTNCVRASLPILNDGASIVNVTSVEAYHSAPGFAVYAAMKAAVQQFTQSLAVELGSRGIRVNCVAPDMIPTPGDAGLADDSGALIDGLQPTPLGRKGTAEECAAVICFLASDMSSFVTGSSIPVDGGTVAAGSWKDRDERRRTHRQAVRTASAL